MAKEIGCKVKDATLILIGCSPLDANGQAKIGELEVLGVKVAYKQIDVTQEQEVAGLIRIILEDFGSLNGIIPSARVIRDDNKTKEELQAFLAPNANGPVDLDQVGKDLPFEIFILFSSSSAVFGNIGQADYSTANAYMDVYAN